MLLLIDGFIPERKEADVHPNQNYSNNSLIYDAS